MRKTRPFGRVFRGVSDTVWQDFRGVRFGSSRPFYALAQTAARIISEVLAGASRYTKESGLVHDVLVKKVD